MRRSSPIRAAVSRRQEMTRERVQCALALAWSLAVLATSSVNAQPLQATQAPTPGFPSRPHSSNNYPSSLHQPAARFLQDCQTAWGQTFPGWSGATPECSTANGITCDWSGMILEICKTPQPGTNMAQKPFPSVCPLVGNQSSPDLPLPPPPPPPSLPPSPPLLPLSPPPPPPLPTPLSHPPPNPPNPSPPFPPLPSPSPPPPLLHSSLLPSPPLLPTSSRPPSPPPHPPPPLPQPPPPLPLSPLFV
ncbi:unnamed protein product [Closterium sp. NIES-65]|nr:unnamed protein product [Closterium sp. NIES-65]